MPDAPLLTEFNEYLARPNSPLNVYAFKKNMNVPIQDIILKQGIFGRRPPDYVYRGFPTGAALKESKHYIEANKIKVIVEAGDIYCFVLDDSGYTDFGGTPVDYLVVRWRQTEGFGEEALLESFIQKSNLKYAQTSLKHAKIMHVLLAINPKKYESAELERDVDVSMMCRWYKNRQVAREVILKMKGINRVLSNFPVATQETLGKNYVDILHRSKIFVVEGVGERAFMCQKYLEGAVCGAMLLGQIPFTARDVFEDRVSIAEVKDFSKIDEKIRYYLKYDDERQRIAEEGRRRVLANFSIDKAVKDFENTLLKEMASGD